MARHRIHSLHLYQFREWLEMMVRNYLGGGGGGLGLFVKKKKKNIPTHYKGCSSMQC